MASDIFVRATVLFTAILTVSSRPSSTPQPVNCRHLKRRILQCLRPYEKLLRTYQSKTTSYEEQDRMRTAFCYEYNQSLQCIHQSYLQCMPEEQHLAVVERRLGHWRQYMSEECQKKPSPPTLPPTAPPTTRYPCWGYPCQTSPPHNHRPYHYPGYTMKPHIMFIEVNAHQNSLAAEQQSRDSAQRAQPVARDTNVSTERPADTQPDVKACTNAACTHADTQNSAMFQRSHAHTQYASYLLLSLYGLVIGYCFH